MEEGGNIAAVIESLPLLEVIYLGKKARRKEERDRKRGERKNRKDSK